MPTRRAALARPGRASGSVYVIAGNPQTVRERLTECTKSLRVGHLMVLLQIRSIVAVDCFLVPTLTVRLLFVFVVLRHARLVGRAAL